MIRDVLEAVLAAAADLRALREAVDRNTAETAALRRELLAGTLAEDRLLTREDVAALVQRHPKTVARWEREARVRPARQGNRVVYSLAEARGIVRDALAGRLE